MKKTTAWLLLFQLFIIDVSCNDAILSKFHQNRFKIKDIRIELTNYSKTHFNFAEVKTYKYNRTTPAFNVTINLKVTIKDQMEMVLQANKFLSNEYRHFPLRFRVNLQKAFRANAAGLQRVMECGNVTTFYFEKDITYHFCNYVLDETRFPPLIPNGRFRMDIILMFLETEVAFASTYLEIYTPIAYPKK